MLQTYPTFKRFEVDEIYKKLPKTEQKLITDYLFYRQSCGLQRTSDLRRALIQIRHIIDCNFKDFKDLNQHTRLVVLIMQSHLSNKVKQNHKIDLNNFFGEYLFSDWWSAKFKRIYSNKNGNKGDNYKKSIDLPTDKEIENMLNAENSTYFKTFLLVQTATGLRTKETRQIEIKKITFNHDGTTTIEIHMTKTGKDKVVFTDKQTTFWIKKLIKEYESSGKLGKYLFQSKNNPDKAISRSIVNYWFKNLSIKSTGKHFIPYSLRHKKATMLYNLAKNNKIAESTALKLLGHNKSQMGTYDHTPKDEDIKILKEQAFNIDVSPEKKHELEIRIEEQDKFLEEMKRSNENLMNDNKKIKEQMNEMLEIVDQITKTVKNSGKKHSIKPKSI